MLFRVLITDSAQSDIDDLARYCRDYSEVFWEEQEERLAYVFEVWFTTTPMTWNFFFVTGAPYRAYLFEVGARTKFWIVYTVDEEKKVVNVLRVWNTSKDRGQFRA